MKVGLVSVESLQQGKLGRFLKEPVPNLLHPWRINAVGPTSMIHAATVAMLVAHTRCYLPGDLRVSKGLELPARHCVSLIAICFPTSC